MNLSTWYRKSESNTYHLAGPQWVDKGKALCGTDLNRVSNTYTEDSNCIISPTPESLGRERCETCKRLREEMQCPA